MLEMALSRAVGFAELYLLMRAVRRLCPDLLKPSASPAVDDLVRKLRRAAKSFEVLKRVWADDLATDLDDAATWSTPTAWKDFVVVRDLRHVLVHRLGAWEPALDPKPNLDERIRRLGVAPDMYRGLVPLDDHDLEAAIKAAITVIDELDNKW
jgi:hypothetical protein